MHKVGYQVLIFRKAFEIFLSKQWLYVTACLLIFILKGVYTDGHPGFVHAVFVCLTIWLLALLLCLTLVCWLQISTAVIYVQNVQCHLFLALFWCLSHLLYDAFMQLIYVAVKYWLQGEIRRCFYHTVQKVACHDHIFLLTPHLKLAEGMKIWILDGFEEEHSSPIRESTVGLKSCFEFPECDVYAALGDSEFFWVSALHLTKCPFAAFDNLHIMS